MLRKHEAPLGLPEGSVRALICSIVLLVWALLAVFNLLDDRYDEALKILYNPPDIVVIVVTYYFIKRATEYSKRRDRRSTDAS